MVQAPVQAQAAAALNHPGIVTLHSLEEADGVTALVLELIEGPTLAERIERGPIPFAEALPIASQIAESESRVICLTEQLDA